MRTIDKDKLREMVAVVGRFVDSSPGYFVRSLHQLLQEFSDEESRQSIARYVPGVGESFGTPVPVLRAMAKEVARHGRERPDQVRSVIETLWRNGTREERLIAAFTAGLLAGADRQWVEELVLGFVDEVSNWEVCDQLAYTGLGPATVANPAKALTKVAEWLVSPNKWIRRFGVASLVPLAHDREYKDTAAVLQAIRPVMTDPDPDVKKAVGWLLRDLTPKDGDAVGGFLAEWAGTPDRNTGWIVKNGMTKLPEEVQAAIRGKVEAAAGTA